MEILQKNLQLNLEAQAMQMAQNSKAQVAAHKSNDAGSAFKQYKFPAQHPIEETKVEVEPHRASNPP